MEALVLPELPLQPTFSLALSIQISFRPSTSFSCPPCEHHKPDFVWHKDKSGSVVHELRLRGIRMHFSLTKEVGWDADDEGEDPKLGLGVKKRYRFIVDFSRRSSKDSTKSKKTDFKAPLPKADFELYEGEPDSYQHSCYCCGEVRSDRYNADHPLKRGKTPRPSLCTQCRYFRKVRVANRGRKGKNRHRRRFNNIDDRVDEREWCASCGTLRSNRYHEKLLLGKLPPWNEVCGHCMIVVEKQNRLERARLYYGELDTPDGTDTEKRDPLRDSLQHRRSSPYAFTPTTSREDMKVGSSATSASGFVTQVEHSHEKCCEKQSSAATLVDGAESVVSGAGKAAKDRSANTQKTTVENATSETGSKHVQAEHEMRQNDRQTQQLHEAQSARQPRHQKKHFGSSEEPKVQSGDLEGHIQAPPPTMDPQPAISKQAKQRQDERDPQPKMKSRSHDTAPTAAAFHDSIQQPELRETHGYFKLRHEKGKVPAEQIKSKVSAHETPIPAAPTSDTFKQQPDAHEAREYFWLRQEKRPETYQRPKTKTEPTEAPTSAPAMNNASQGQQEASGSREHRRTRRGHEKQLSISSGDPSRPQQEPFYFRMRNSSRQPQTQFQDKQQPKQQQQFKEQPEPQAPKQQAPPPRPRPMGISDMYWASTEGQAETEQTFTAGGFFFPGGAYDFAPGSGPGPRREGTSNSAGNPNPNINGNNSKKAYRNRESGTASSSSSARPHRAQEEHANQAHTTTAAAQIWEVDSDEAAEIELHHARLVARGNAKRGKSKARKA